MLYEKELLEKIKGHIDERDIPRLKSLIEEADDFNKKCHQFVEIWIDFDNEGYPGSECDPYETFCIRIRPVNDEVSKAMYYWEKMSADMTLDQLDYAMCALTEYMDETGKITDFIDKSLEEDNKKLTETIHNKEREGKIVYKDLEGIKCASLDKFTEQGLNGQLYDINRLPEVIYTLQNTNWEKYNQRWINDIALINLCKYYYNKCAELEGKLKMAEDKIVTNSIIK